MTNMNEKAMTLLEALRNSLAQAARYSDPPAAYQPTSQPSSSGNTLVYLTLWRGSAISAATASRQAA
jgi:hypothetical protein